MTNIIELAKEAGFIVQIHGECFGHTTLEHRFNPDRLEAFAALVRAEVEAEWIDTNKALAKEILEQEWFDLTDDEMFSIADKVGFDGELMKINNDRGMPSIAELYVKAVIASFKEKNK